MIYQNGFSEDERKSYKDVIHSNVIISMRSLVLAVDRLGLQYSTTEAKERAAFFTSTNMLASQELTPKVADDVRFLWKEPAIKQAFARASEFQLTDSAG
jgi:guanine nucleotide-binding protein G(i) subunit alpha